MINEYDDNLLANLTELWEVMERWGIVTTLEAIREIAEDKEIAE